MGDPVVIIVAVGISVGVVIDGFHHLRQIVDGVVLITHTMAVSAARLHILHHPVDEVIVVSGGSAGGRVCDCC